MNCDHFIYRNDPRFSDRAISEDPDQGLHCLPFLLHHFHSLLYVVQILG